MDFGEEPDGDLEAVGHAALEVIRGVADIREVRINHVFVLIQGEEIQDEVKGSLSVSYLGQEPDSHEVLTDLATYLDILARQVGMKATVTFTQE